MIKDFHKKYHKCQCLRCGEYFYVRIGVKKDLCLMCLETLKGVMNDKRKRK